MPEAPAHILVIDDDKAMRDACFQILSRQGYRVELAASAKQGLTLLERLSFDAILLDLVMPDMDGLEALKRIRALDPDVEVIIITGYGTIQSAVESIKAGAFHFLSKPFVPDDLRNLVTRALEKAAAGPGKPLSAPGTEDQGRAQCAGLRKRIHDPDHGHGCPGGPHGQHRAHHRRIRHRQGT